MPANTHKIGKALWDPRRQAGICQHAATDQAPAVITEGLFCIHYGNIGAKEVAFGG